MTEQAYHAWGAGREELKSCPKCGGDITREGGHGPWCRDERCKWGWEMEMDGSALREASNEECRKVINQLASDWHNNLTNVEVYALADKYLRPFLAALREPGADTGTTPPEGLAFTFEEFIDMSLRHNKRLAAGISGIASFGHWYNEMLAATQRAPVEQGREKRLPDGAEAMMLDVAEDISQQFCGGSEAVTEIIAAKLTEIIYNSKPTAAPDHAREGALRFATYKDWIASLPKCVGDDGGCDGDLVGLAHERHCPMFGKEFATTKDAFEAGRALADGKEGGE